jgi:MoxR-like ATPase
MQENQVTVDGETYRLEAPFMVLATQNPIEYEGTYPLPEAQLDRFMMLLHLGYPELADEAKMLAEQALADPLETLTPVADGDEIRSAIAAAKALHVEESLNRYVVALLRHTRADGRVVLGGSPRSGIAVMRVAKTRALCSGRDFVTPDDIKAVVEPVLSHRIILSPEARSTGTTGADVIADALRHTPVPV